jgi:hypothetical protein
MRQGIVVSIPGSGKRFFFPQQINRSLIYSHELCTFMGWKDFTIFGVM